MGRRSKKNLLLTGRPGCGKTTVVRSVIEQLGGLRLAGFYTEEIRQNECRVGFEAIGIGGGRAVLAHVDFRTGVRVGRYGVNLPAFDPLVLEELGKPTEEVDLFVIDEVGKMEGHSQQFVQAVRKALNSGVPVLATVGYRGAGFISEVKGRPDVELLTVDPANRDRLPEQLVRRLLPR